VFQELVGEILSQVDPGSVIVMDNNPSHSIKIHRHTLSSQSRDGVQWFKSKHRTDEPRAAKNELQKSVGVKCMLWTDVVSYVAALLQACYLIVVT
jgi:hypothetical protein